MNLKTLTKIDWIILVFAILLSGGAYIFFGVQTFYSVSLGATVAFFNWIASRWLGVRLILAGNRLKVAVFLGLKTALILGLIGVIIVKTSVEPFAFLVGLSVLVLGVVSRGFFGAVAEGDKKLREEIE